MKSLHVPYFQRTLLRLLLPVTIIGLLVSTFLVDYMSAPLKNHLARQFDANLSLSSLMGLQTCEEGFNYLLDLRLETNQEMNEVLQKEALEKMRIIGEQFPDIQLMVVTSEHLIQTSLLKDNPDVWKGPNLLEKDNSTFAFELKNQPVRAHVQFFPFWDWNIISYVYENEYKTPLQMAQTITHMSAIGVLFTMLLTLLIVFHFLINNPLKKLTKATAEVSDGLYSKVDTIPQGEFGLLTTSFNSMVDSLENEKRVGEKLFEQLKESEALFRSQFEFGSIGIGITTANESLVRANERFCDMLGYSEKQLCLTPWSEIFLPSDFEKGLIYYVDMLADKHDNYQLDARLRNVHGGIVFTHISVSCIRNKDRSVRYGIISVIDITERHRAEIDLEETNRTLRLVLDTIPVSVFWKDLQGRYVGGNRSFSEGAELASHKDLVGKTDYELMFSAQADLYRNDDRAVINSGEARLFHEDQHIRDDGTIKWLLTNKVPMRDDQENIIGVLGTYQDITDRKNAENELQKLQNYLANIIDSMPSILVGLNNQGLVTQWNIEAQRATGYSQTEALGQPLEKVMPRLSDEMNRVHSAIATKTQLSEIKQSQTGGDKPIFENITIFPLVTNGVEGAVIRIDDVTREKQLEGQLNHSRKLEAIGTLAGGVAHDFNNMLGGILGATELLSFYLPDDPKAKKLHRTIFDATTRAADLTSKLLTFSRQSPQASSVVEVHDIIRETSVLLENTIDRRIVINLDLNAASAVIVGDPSQLQNAFLNLGINGSHSMTEGGILTFSTQQLDIDALFCEVSSFNIEPGKYLEVEVRDTGCGISPEDQDKIFDPFFTTKAQGVGTGLGLAAVYGVVQQHQGAIHVYSAPDSGTSFQMLFPLSTEELPLALNLPPVMKGSGRILVVDDEEVMRITAQAILEDLGYEVILANDGEQAVKVYEKNQEDIDLVILDMVMPIMNGRDCFLRLKELDINVRVILASGFSREDDIQEMKINGLEGFIRKPYSRSNFSQIVHKVLS